MARPKEFDERIALAAAMQVFWEKGYEATSMGDLTERMQIGRPSLYATYGGKRELFEAALRSYVASSLDYVERQLKSGPSVQEALLAYFQGMVEGPAGRDPAYGCLCVNTMVELAPHDPVFADITGVFQERLTTLFRTCIEEGIRSGELSSRLNPGSIAGVLTLTAVGLSVTMKTKPDPARMTSIAADIVALLA